MNNKKIQTVLIISAMLNVLFVGIFIGCTFKRIKRHRRMPMSGMHRMNEGRPCHKDIERQQQNSRKHDQKPESRFKKTMQENPNIRKAHKKLEEALLKEPYNKKGILEAFANLDKEMDKSRKEMHEFIANKAKDLSPEERLNLIPHGNMMKNK